MKDERPPLRYPVWEGVSYSQATESAPSIKRPWQRRPWQETPIGRLYHRPSLRYDRHGVSRAQHVDLRCLICLAQPKTFRPRPASDEDQVCDACDKASRRARQPWGVEYEAFVVKRRAKYKKANEHLAALDIAAARFERFVQAPMADVLPLTRPNPNDVICDWDTGGPGGIGSVSSF